MAKRRITADVVKGLTPGAVVFDTEVRGFMVRHRGGSAIYALKTRIKGRQTVLTIGRHGKGAFGPESARREAIRLLGLIRDGKDIAADRAAAKAAPTLAEFCIRYLNEYAGPQHKPRTFKEEQRLLKLHVLPALGRMKLQDLGKADMARLHSKLHETPVAANRALALLSAVLGWAEKVGQRPDGTNPCRHIDRYPERARERLATAEELARLGEALDRGARGWTAETRVEWRRACEAQAELLGIAEASQEAWVAARQPRRESAEDWRAIAAFRLLAFTGARLSEILTLQWEWIDVAAGVARLPDSKTGAKNLYLPPGALAVLEELPRIAGNPHVLPGDRPGSPFVGIQKPWQRVRALAGLPDLRIHDLRHAFASTAVAAGDSLFIVGKLLGHRQASTTERYSHLAPDPAKAVADRTAERLRAMMEGGKGDVLEMPGTKRAG
ncbi:MAG TPA: tyrosine-type recombinase/integrase [Acetobacteraceae bacterium]|nr:tyrosine-type recombinase/integrase [Acetobacteraceae bacterium]